MIDEWQKIHSWMPFSHGMCSVVVPTRLIVSEHSVATVQVVGLSLVP